MTKQKRITLFKEKKDKLVRKYPEEETLNDLLAVLLLCAHNEEQGYENSNNTTLSVGFLVFQEDLK